MQQQFGTGNIIGVSTAIIIGGIGSVFWIFISGIFAISTKYAETYLCMKYRKICKAKNIKYTKYYGGTMYVLKDRIGSEFLGFVFSIFVIIASFGIGCMIQSNSTVQSLSQNLNINKYMIGIFITLIAAYILFSSARKISKISSIIVPVSILTYIIMCLILLYMFRNNLLNSILLILKDAFNIESGVTGIITFLTMKSLVTGLSKGMFSNEAGMGSSPLFEVTVNNTDIKKQSMISSTSVFIDTIFMCSLTGILLVSSNLYINETDSIRFVQNVFGLIPYGRYLLTFCIASFGIATIPCWGYYGSQAIRYIFNKRDVYQKIYKIIYVICIYIGAICATEIVWTLSSISNALMVIPNLFMIYYLIDEIE